MMASTLEQRHLESDTRLRFKNRWFFLLFALITFKLLYVYALPVNSDEPQHLHLSWGWANGLVQYKDMFDNHTPLFHLFMTPFLEFFGERADIINVMRFLMLPFWLGILLIIYNLVRKLDSLSSAVLSTLVLAFTPGFMLVSTEYRADIPWVFLWVLLVWYVCVYPMTRKRLVTAGLIGGIMAMTSMKGVLMVPTLCLAWIIPALANRSYGRSRLNIEGLKRFFLFGISCALPCFLIFLLMSILGAWDAMIYCLFQHSTVPLDEISEPLLPSLLRLTLGVTGLGAAFLAGREKGNRPLAKSWFLATASLYYLVVHFLFPVVERQTQLSYYAIGIPAIMLSLNVYKDMLLSSIKTKWSSVHFEKVVFFVCIALLVVCVTKAPPWRFSSLKMQDLLTEVITLTEEDDLILDQKGESVYRRRSHYFVLETFTLERMMLELIPQTAWSELIEKEVPIVVNDNVKEVFGQDYGFFHWTRMFIKYNYHEVGYVSVAGKYLVSEEADDQGRIPFKVEVPAEYVFISPKGIVTGYLNEELYEGETIYLESGDYTFTPNDMRSLPIIFIWERAYREGYLPEDFN